MEQSKTKRALRIVCGTFLAVWAVVDYIGAAVMLDFTFVRWWIPAIVAFAVAAVSGLLLWRMWKWLTCRSTFYSELYLPHFVFYRAVYDCAACCQPLCALGRAVKA